MTENLTFSKTQINSTVVDNFKHDDCVSNGTDNFLFRNNPSNSVFELYTLNKIGHSFNYLDNSMGSDSSSFLAQFLLDMNPFFYPVFKDLSKQKIGSVLQKMWQISALNYGSFVKGGISYCSHSEGYLTTLKNSRIMREKYESYFHENFSTLKSLYVETKNHLKTSQINLEHLKKQVEVSISEGKVYFYHDISNHIDDDGLLMSSDFHRALMTNKNFQDRLANDNEFKANRFITICEYLWLRNLGTDIQKRMFYCYLCYRTIEEVDKIDYISLVKN